MASVEEILAQVKLQFTNATIILIVAGATNATYVSPVPLRMPPRPVLAESGPPMPIVSMALTRSELIKRGPLPVATNEDYHAHRARLEKMALTGQHRSQ